MNANLSVARTILHVALLLAVWLSLTTLGGAASDDYEDYETVSLAKMRSKNDKCSVPFLNNGRAKIRSRGRVAKFICRPFFQTVGKRFATCIRGRWSFPPPLCISQGCAPLSAPRNGRVSMEMKGAMAKFYCNPGYTLTGGASLYCDSVWWNSTDTPKCRPTLIDTLDSADACDFEADLCGWFQDPSDDFDFQWSSLTAPSDAGPSFDQTLGDPEQGYYMYVEASSSRKVNDTARLFSPVFKGTGSGEYGGGCFRFSYHMHGEATGYLKVYVKPEQTVMSHLEPIFVKSKNQGNLWHSETIRLPDLLDRFQGFQIVIEAIRGTGYSGVIAIDDVTLSSKAVCDSIWISSKGSSTTTTKDWRNSTTTWESTELTSSISVTSLPPLSSSSSSSDGELGSPQPSTEGASSFVPLEPAVATATSASPPTPPVVEVEPQPSTHIDTSGWEHVTTWFVGGPDVGDVTSTPEMSLPVNPPPFLPARSEDAIPPTMNPTTAAPSTPTSSLPVQTTRLPLPATRLPVPTTPTAPLPVNTTLVSVTTSLRATTTSSPFPVTSTLPVTKYSTPFPVTTTSKLPTPTTIFLIPKTKATVLVTTPTKSTLPSKATIIPTTSAKVTITTTSATSRSPQPTIPITTTTPNKPITTTTTTTTNKPVTTTTTTTTTNKATTTTTNKPITTTIKLPTTTTKKPITITTTTTKTTTKPTAKPTTSVTPPKATTTTSKPIPTTPKARPPTTRVTFRTPPTTKTTKRASPLASFNSTSTTARARTIVVMATTKYVTRRSFPPATTSKSKYPVTTPTSVRPNPQPTRKPAVTPSPTPRRSSARTTTTTVAAILKTNPNLVTASSANALTSAVTSSASERSNHVDGHAAGDITAKPRAVLPPWTYLRTTPSIERTNQLSPYDLQTRSTRSQVSVPTVVGVAAVALVSLVVVAVVVKGVYKKRRLRQHQLSEYSDVRYLKDGEDRVDLSDCCIKDDDL